MAFSALTAFSQGHQPVFPALTGQELLDSLVSNFKSSIPLDQADGRDTLFAKIYNHNDSLTCVYTGFTIWLDPSQDPTQAAFMNDGPDAVNTEHTYPQSLGASGPAEGDLHHLYPSRKDVNAARANSPFAEIPDNQTDTWYYLDQKQTTIPLMNKDRYSEKKGDLFEPREDHKGNVARAMFYFYTMYKEQADLEDNTYFELQRPTLCNWHFLDPVDQDEWDRTFRIAPYQEGKPNPFVLDCTLPERCYCSQFLQTCEPLDAPEAVDYQPVTLLQNNPNPFSGTTTFYWNLQSPGWVRLDIYNELGEHLATPVNEWQAAGEQQFHWQKPASMGAGLAFCRMIFTNERSVSSEAQSMLIVR